MKTQAWVISTTAALLGAALSISAANAATVENVILTDAGGKMQIKASQSTVKAGKVTFNVKNLKSSASEHEMLVVRLNKQEVANPNSLPYIDNEAKFNEEAVNDRGEVSELQPGESGTLTLTLKPGTYLLACNVAGHYKAGMYTELHVK